MYIRLPENVKQIIETLNKAGFEAWAVGGCVRDSLLGRVPKDWDITTDALPGQIKSVFKRTVDTGIEHGTVTVLLGSDAYEVTTYRIDGEYKDARHPSSVEFTTALSEDLLRRDFTINAMAYNDEAGLVDMFGGAGDLEKGCVRCVGEARERFSEDALRMMRAVRFGAELGFYIEEDTKRAIKELSGNLSRISAERIQAELVKLVTSPNPGRMRDLYELGITDIVLPEFSLMMETPQHNPHHIYSVGEHTIHAMENIEPEKTLRLAMLFHDAGKPVCLSTDEEGTDHFYGHPKEGAAMTSRIMRRLKFDNETRLRTAALVRAHDAWPALTQKSVRKAVSKYGEDIFPDIFKVKRADILAQSSFHQTEKLDYLAQYEKIYEDMVKADDCISLKQLAVNGRDLIEAGMSPGPGIGEMLHKMLEDVLEDPHLNSKEILLRRYDLLD